MIYHRFLQRFAPATILPLHVKLMDPQDDALEHEHDLMELVVVLKGHGEQYGEGYHGEVTAGDVFLVSRGVSHGYRKGSPDFSLVNILFLPDSLPLPPLDISLLPGFRIFYSGQEHPSLRYPGIHAEGEDFQQISSLAKELYSEYSQKDNGYLFCCIGIFMQLLCRILRIYSRSVSLKRKYVTSVSAAISYLNTHYRQEIALDELCRISNMSKSSLMRNFTNAAGCSLSLPHGWSRRWRYSPSGVVSPRCRSLLHW